MSFVNLLVLRCADFAKTRAFHECIGLEFEGHKHRDGPLHSGTMDNMGLVLELYPASENNPIDRCGIGFGSANLEQVIASMVALGFAPGQIQQQAWGRHLWFAIPMDAVSK